MELDLEIEIRGCLVGFSEDAMDPYYIIVKVLFEEVEIDKYILDVSDKLDGFPHLFRRIISYNRLVDFESEFIGWCTIDGKKKRFSNATKMKDIDSYISEFICSFSKRRYYIRVYFKSV